MIGRLRHVALVILTAASLVISPVLAQAQEPQTQAPSSNPNKPVGNTPAAQEARDMRQQLGPDYSKGQPFPRLLAPYRAIKVPPPILVNSARISQLIQGGKLMLSLEDAISLALENNLNITVQKFSPWIAETQLLKAKAGGVPQLSNTQQVVLGTSPSVSFDPLITGTVGWERSTIPVNNPFISGTGTSTAVEALTTNAYQYNFGFTQGFHTGTNFSVTFDTTRAASNTPENLFNPYIQPTLTATLTQPLLNGFGILVNTRYIIEAKNSIKAADSQFAQQVILTVTTVSNDYWELVYDRENVKVQEAAVGVSRKLYGDNKKQLEIGTMAPLDVLTAESQLATDEQNLIVAQTTQRQQQTVLLNDITKNLLAQDIAGVEVIPTTAISNPDVIENMSLQDAVQEAWKKRPEIYQADLNLKNAGIEVKATKNGLLPSLNLYAQFSQTGLSGNEIVQTSSVPTGNFVDTAAPIVDANGNPLILANPFPATAGSLAFVGSPNFPTALKTAGLGSALDNMITNAYPTYAAGVNFALPIRNRSAQADSARALLDERLQQVQYQQTQNTIVLNVHNTMIALQQDRNQVAAAEKARNLAQQTLDAEQKKYQLGSSTSYNVVLRSRDLTAAEGTELRAKVNLEEAVVNFNQAMGRTLEVNHITVADAKNGKVFREPQIPGTPDGNLAVGAK
jgi:outer membrane protein TolC